MAVTAVAKKTPAGKAKKAVKPTHPPYKNMIKAAIKNLKGQNGTSRQAILKYIISNYKIGDEKKASTRLRLALKKAVASGILAHAKGAGAAGSFHLAKDAKVAKPQKARKSKAKKPVAKKAISKPAAIKPPKKSKAKKPAAKKASKKSAIKKAKISKK